MYRSRSRLHRSATPTWSVGADGFVDEAITNWQAPVPEAPPAESMVRMHGRVWTSTQLTPVPVLSRTHARVRHTVLLVARQREVRRRLRECLEGQAELRVVDVGSIAAAVALAGEVAVHLIIADSAAWSVSRQLPDIRSILLSDHVVGHDPTLVGPRQHLMLRPFSPETLAATVHLLLRDPD